MVDPGLEELIMAGPAWQRPGKRLLLSLVRRPRGLALLKRFTPADQATGKVIYPYEKAK